MSLLERRGLHRTRRADGQAKSMVHRALCLSSPPSRLVLALNVRMKGKLLSLGWWSSKHQVCNSFPWLSSYASSAAAHASAPLPDSTSSRDLVPVVVPGVVMPWGGGADGVLGRA